MSGLVFVLATVTVVGSAAYFLLLGGPIDDEEDEPHCVFVTSPRGHLFYVGTFETDENARAGAQRFAAKVTLINGVATVYNFKTVPLSRLSREEREVRERDAQRKLTTLAEAWRENSNTN